MTPEQALRHISALTAAFRPRDWSQESALVYAEAVSDLHPEDLGNATVALIRRSAFMPTVAEIRSETRKIRDRRIGDLSSKVPDADPDDIAAWLDALRAGRFRDESPELGPTRQVPAIERLTRRVGDA